MIWMDLNGSINVCEWPWEMRPTHHLTLTLVFIWNLKVGPLPTRRGAYSLHVKVKYLGNVCVPGDHFGSCCSTVRRGFAAQVSVGAGELPCFSAQASLWLEASRGFGKAGWAILGSVLQPDRGLYLIRVIPSSQRGLWRGSTRVTTAHPKRAMTRELNKEAVFKIDTEAHAFTWPLPLCSSLLCPGLGIRKNSWWEVEGGTGV